MLESALPLPLEDQVQFPAPTLAGSQPPVTLAPGDAIPSSGLHGSPHTCVTTYTVTHIYTLRSFNKSKDIIMHI